MNRIQPRDRILHQLLEAILVLTEKWPNRTSQDVAAGAINYLAQAAGIQVVMVPLADPFQAANAVQDAPF